MQITDFEPTIEVDIEKLVEMQKELGDLIVGDGVIIVFDAPMMDE